MKGHKFFNYCSHKCLNLGARVLNYGKCSSHNAQDRKTWSKLHQQKHECIPKDVPRGHLAVYVGKDCKRYVIKVSLLRHPLFKALLDLTEEVLGFAAASKLCIPCSESIFVRVLNLARSQQDHKLFLSCF